jgi:putative FmdB family regulatory protein
MPVYEYRCTSCGERTEAQQHVGDPPLSKCPRCGGVLEKVVSVPALRFKGSGWYVTDYARRGRPDTSAKDESSASAKPETSPAKPDSAPTDKGTAKDKPPKTK